MQVRVLIVSDVPLYREGLVSLLRQRPGIVRVEAVRTYWGARDSVSLSMPDLILVDVAASNGFEVIEQLIADRTAARIMALTVTGSDSDIVACAEVGVCGFVTRDSTIQDLEKAIHAAMRDELHCSPKTTASLFRQVGVLAAGVPDGAALGGISVREREVLSLLEQNLSDKRIALELGIAVSTVKNHVHRILKKLDVHSRGAAGAVLRRELTNSGDSRAPSPPG